MFLFFVQIRRPQNPTLDRLSAASDVYKRLVVFCGFALAVVSSILFPPLLFQWGLIEFETASDRLVRIATASGLAFLLAQLLDVTVFHLSLIHI